MNIFNLKVPKDSISMIFDEFNEVENYSTSLYLYKSNIVLDDEKNIYTAKLEVDLNKKDNKSKLVKQILNKEYGSFIITFLNADFSSAESAYYSFFVFYGLEGFEQVAKIKEKFPVEYTVRYTSSKKFLDYYHKVFDFVKDDYIKFQNDMRKAVDFTFGLRNTQTHNDIDKYSKFVAYSNYAHLSSQFNNHIDVSILEYDTQNKSVKKTLNQLEKLAYEISTKKTRYGNFIQI